MMTKELQGPKAEDKGVEWFIGKLPFLKSNNPIYIFTYFFLISLAFRMVLVAFFGFIGIADNQMMNDKLLEYNNIIELGFRVVLITPFFETLIFQYGVIKLVRKFWKNLPKYSWIIVVISSLLFAVTHLHDIYYCIAAFVSGIILVLLYFASEQKNLNPFLMVFLVHAANNLLAFLGGIL